MTTHGRYAASDSSFAQSTGNAASKGLALIAVAVVIGFLLLWQGGVGGDSSVEVTVSDANNITIEGCSRSAFGNQDVDDGNGGTNNEDSFNKVTVTVSGFGAGDITTSTEAAVAGDCPTPA